MQAILAENNKPVFAEIPNPTPQANELLVAVKATALNRADLLQVMGKYPPPPDAPATLGLEFAGEVIGMGQEVQGFHIGQRVMALVGGGGYAEQAVVHYQHAMPIPETFSFTDAAAIPEAFLTAYANMVQMARLQPGEKVLIHAGASGVGLAAIQIAKSVDAIVIVTASLHKHALCRHHGADLCIDYQSEDFAAEILEAFQGVDVIVELVGAPYWESNLKVLNQWGRLVFVGLMGGATHEVNFSTLMQKRLSIMGSTLRNRTTSEKTALVQAFWGWAEPLFLKTALRPTVWEVYPWTEVEAAHTAMRENRNAGKIVLSIP